MAIAYKPYKCFQETFMLPYRTGEDEKDYFFYMFRRHTDGLTKIGITDNVYRRIKAVSKYCGVKLHPIFWIQMKNQKDARALEKKFLDRKNDYYGSRFRQEGEWFNLPLEHLLEMQNDIRARAWDLYEVKAKMMRQPTVLYLRVDEAQKRLEAIASSLDIEYKDVPTVWQLLNNTYMVNFHCLQNFFDESPRLRLEKEYPDHLKIRALVQSVMCITWDTKNYTPDKNLTHDENMEFLCWLMVEKMLHAYADDVDEAYLQRCIQAFDTIYKNTEFLEYFDLLEVKGEQEEKAA